MEALYYDELMDGDELATVAALVCWKVENGIAFY